MVDTALLPALKEALRQNEIGDASPYVLSYARLGQSGASFGMFQADTNVDDDARRTLQLVLETAGAASYVISRIVAALSRPLPHGTPLDPEDERIVNQALASSDGRLIVDRMDGRTLGIIGHELDSAIAAAAQRRMSIDPVAQLAIGLWVNMTGTPTALSAWLRGAAIGGLSPPKGPSVTRADMDDYLRNTNYFRIHPRNLIHFAASVEAGARLVPHPAVALGMMDVAGAIQLTDTPLAGTNHWLYVQRTGRMFHVISGVPSLLAKGYSGTGVAENNPDRQFEQDHGPLPRGGYTIEAPVPFNRMMDCLPLLPDRTNSMGGRGGFLIHDGAFVGRPHGATSHGCICLIHSARLTIWDSNDHHLVVVQDDP